MTHDELIALARQVSNTPLDATSTPDLFGANQIVAFAKLVAANEREACAKLVDYWEAREGEHTDAIRARGK